jgi:hypothetical protein
VRVPLGDAVYQEIDQLSGSGIIPSLIYLQRPYTLQDVLRIVDEAGAELARNPNRASPSTQRLVRRLEVRYARALRESHDRSANTDALSAHADRGVDARKSSPLRNVGNGASAGMLLLDSPSRIIPSEPVGTVNADVNPLLNDREGRRYEQGMTAAMELWTAWTIGNHFGFQLQPRIAAGGKAAQNFSEVTLHEASASAAARNVVVGLGRQQFAWGPAMDGGLMFSASGRPLDAVTISTIAPWRAPWVFRHLGGIGATALLADLGASQNFPHAKLAAYKINFAVHPNFEFAVAAMAHEGGRGAPEATLVDRIADIVPGLQYFAPSSRSQLSNKLAGIDLRLRIPALHALRLYSEDVFDDWYYLRYRTLWQDGGHIFGASLADLGAGGAYSAIAEFHHTGLRYYEHTVFNSGISFNRTLIGDPLGPQGDGAYLRFRRDAGTRSTWQVDAAIERRGADSYATDPVVFRFVLVQSHPAEWRHRIAANWTIAPTAQQAVSLQLGAERVRDASFVRGAHRVNALAGVQWSWRAWR